ncbi:MAG: hypothetical protein IT374_13610 [Polyangiaceae bacterium]|nr:hypothetical protein [Polyangiaceae bacterium]
MALGVALGIALVLAVAYALYTARAHRALVAVVRRGQPPSLDAPPAWTLRAGSVTALARAYWFARRGEVLDAERALRGVARGELGAWEQRVLEATRALVCMENRELASAARLAPLAIPTGDADVDRRLARVLLLDAWHDADRLVAIARALSDAGPHLGDCGEVARLREEQLVTGELVAGHPQELLTRAATVAYELGEDAFGDTLLSLAERRGVYR